MATASIAGYSGFVYAGASTGTPAKIAELREWTLSMEMSEIDATSHDSSGAREVIGGITNWSGSAEYLYAGDNASQKALHTLLSGRTASDFYFYPAGTSSEFPIYTGSGYVTSWEVSGPNEDALAASVDFVGTAALTQTTSS